MIPPPVSQAILSNGRPFLNGGGGGLGFVGRMVYGVRGSGFSINISIPLHSILTREDGVIQFTTAVIVSERSPRSCITRDPNILSRTKGTPPPIRDTSAGAYGMSYFVHCGCLPSHHQARRSTKRSKRIKDFNF